MRTWARIVPIPVIEARRVATRADEVDELVDAEMLRPAVLDRGHDPCLFANLAESRRLRRLIPVNGSPGKAESTPLLVLLDEQDPALGTKLTAAAPVRRVQRLHRVREDPAHRVGIWMRVGEAPAVAQRGVDRRRVIDTRACPLAGGGL